MWQDDQQISYNEIKRIIVLDALDVLTNCSIFHSLQPDNVLHKLRLSGRHIIRYYNGF